MAECGPVTEATGVAHLPDAGEDAPFVEFDREEWSRLAASTPLPLTEADIDNLRGLGDPIDLHEVDTSYRPLSRLLTLYVEASQQLRTATSTFLGEWTHATRSEERRGGEEYKHGRDATS